MRHVREIHLIALAAGKLPDGERRAVEAHIEACAICQTAFDEAGAVEGALGEWEISAAERDLWPAIEERLARPRPVILRSRWSSAVRISRIAAVIAFAVGFGHVAGRFTWTDLSTAVHPWPEFGEQDIADALGLFVFDAPAPTGLYTTVFGLDSDSDETEVTP